MGRRFALALSLLGCSALSLPAVAQERIVSIGPATTELIMALGGEQSLIATDVSSPEPKGLPRVGYHRALAAEGMLVWPRPDWSAATRWGRHRPWNSCAELASR